MADRARQRCHLRSAHGSLRLGISGPPRRVERLNRTWGHCGTTKPTRPAETRGQGRAPISPLSRDSPDVPRRAASVRGDLESRVRVPTAGREGSTPSPGIENRLDAGPHAEEKRRGRRSLPGPRRTHAACGTGSVPTPTWRSSSSEPASAWAFSSPGQPTASPGPLHTKPNPRNWGAASCSGR